MALIREEVEAMADAGHLYCGEAGGGTGEDDPAAIGNGCKRCNSRRKAAKQLCMTARTQDSAALSISDAEN
jgi:hypothetical protein